MEAHRGEASRSLQLSRVLLGLDPGSSTIGLCHNSPGSHLRWEIGDQSWQYYLIILWEGIHQQRNETSLFLVQWYKKIFLSSVTPIFRWGMTLQLSLSLTADSAHSPPTWFIWAPVGPAWGKAHLGVFNTFPCQAEEKSCTCRIRTLPRGLWPEVSLQFWERHLIWMLTWHACCLLPHKCCYVSSYFYPQPWILQINMLLKFSANQSTCRHLTYICWAPTMCQLFWEKEMRVNRACFKASQAAGDSNDIVAYGCFWKGPLATESKD